MNDRDARLKISNAESGDRVDPMILCIRVAKLHEVYWLPSIEVVDRILNFLNFRIRLTRETVKEVRYLVVRRKRGATGLINNSARQCCKEVIKASHIDLVLDSAGRKWDCSLCQFFTESAVIELQLRRHFIHKDFSCTIVAADRKLSHL